MEPNGKRLSVRAEQPGTPSLTLGMKTEQSGRLLHHRTMSGSLYAVRLSLTLSVLSESVVVIVIEFRAGWEEGSTGSHVMTPGAEGRHATANSGLGEASSSYNRGGWG